MVAQNHVINILLLAAEKCVTQLPLTHLFLCNMSHHLHNCINSECFHLNQIKRACISNNGVLKMSFIKYFIWRQVKLATTSENLLGSIICGFKVGEIKLFEILTHLISASRQIRKDLLFNIWNFRKQFSVWALDIFYIFFAFMAASA